MVGGAVSLQMAERDMGDFNRMTGQPSGIYAVGEGSARATVGLTETEQATLIYTEIQGAVVVSTGVPGSNVPIGALLRGNVRVYSPDGFADMRVGESLLAIPGDDVAYVLTDTRSYTLRIRCSGDLRLRLKAMPQSERAKLRRILTVTESEDLVQLFMFFGREHDRLTRVMRAENSEQLRVIGAAVVERALGQIESIVGEAPHYDPQYLHICEKIDGLVSASGWSSLLAKDLAAHANCSVRQLYRAFESVMDASPIHYLLRSRLLVARSAILSGGGSGKTFRQVCEDAGFSVTPSFVRSYAAEFGEPPAASFHRREKLVRQLVGRTNS